MLEWKRVDFLRGLGWGSVTALYKLYGQVQEPILAGAASWVWILNLSFRLTSNTAEQKKKK